MNQKNLFIIGASVLGNATFRDDHFARLLDYVASKIYAGDYSSEYAECESQVRILQTGQNELSKTHVAGVRKRENQ